MADTVSEIKSAFREVLGPHPGQAFYDRLDRKLDAGRGDMSRVCEACYRAEKTVRLFVCTEKADHVGKRWREIVSGPRQWV